MKTTNLKLIAAALAVGCSVLTASAATLTWTNTSGGNWSVAANWNPNQVPSSSDDVLITVGGTYTVTADLSANVNSLTLGGSSGQQTLNTALNTLELNNNSMVLAHGTLDWAGGSLNWPGSLAVASGGVLNIEGQIALLGALTNSGTVNWQAGGIAVYGAGGGYTGAIWNQAGALWDIQCDSNLQREYGDEEFHNAGVVQKDTTTGTTSFAIFLANGGTVHAESGTIEFDASSDLGGIFKADAGAAVTFAGGNYNWNGSADFQGPGAVQITGGSWTITGPLSSVNFTGVTITGLSNVVGTAYLTNCSINDQETILGTLDWAGGSLNWPGSLAVASGGVLNIEGQIALLGALTNSGTVNWQAGGIAVYGAGGGYTGAIWNQAGALWDIQCDSNLQREYGDEEFHNAGVVQKDTTTGTTSFAIFLANGGTVHAESGTIEFDASSDLGGIFKADAGAAVTFAGGNYNWNGSADFQGPGAVQITGGSWTITGPLSSVNFTGVTITGLSNVVGTAYLTNCSINDQETILGTLDWAGGSLNWPGSLAVASGGVLNIEGQIALLGALTNSGTVNWQAGGIAVYGAGGGYTGAIWNQAGALWDIQCDSNLQREYGDEEFHNAGVVQKDTTTGTTSFAIFLANGGTVHAESGTIEFDASSDLGGIFKADAGAAVTFAGGNYNWNGSADFQGPGAVQITGGSWTITGPLSSVNFTGVTITGLSNVVGTAYLTNCSINDQETILGTLDWAGGTLNSSASLTVASGGVLNIGGQITLYGPLTNSGTVNWQAGGIAVYGAGGGYTGAIWNQAGALWDIQCDSNLQREYGDEEFHNAGVVQKDTTTGTTSFAIFLANSGTIDAQSGIISLDGTYSLTGGTLNVGINNQTDFGQIALSGNATLDGAFSANLNNGFVPTNNSSFQVLTYGSASGTFTNVTATAPPIWETNFTATGMTLTTVSTITWPTPADITYGAKLGGNQLNSFAGVTGNYAYIPPAGTVLQSGNGQNLTVAFTPDNRAYLSATMRVPINVLKAPLTITANDTNKIYGQPVTFPGTEFIAAGLVNGDSVTSASLASTGAISNAPVGGSPYAISITNALGNAGLTNYNITYTSGVLTVNPRPLHITANNRTKTYGQTVAFAGSEFTPIGLQNSETIGTVTLTSAGTISSAPVSSSPYSIVPSAAAGGTFSPGNYAISYTNGTLSVSPAPLGITANNRTKTYGQTVTFASTEFTPVGLKNSETVGTVTLTSSGAISNAPVNGSPYSIVPGSATGGTFSAANYLISYTNGTLTVNKAGLIITADSTNKIFGQAIAFTGTQFTAAGLQNGETVGSVTLTSAGTAATAAVGAYNIVPSTPVGGTFNQVNYTDTFANGALTVFEQPSLTILLTKTNDVVTFPTLTGEMYQLLSATNIATMNWTPVGLSINGTGVSASVTNTIGSQATFYRLQIQN